MDKVLIIIRGVSGSGKTTLAEYLGYNPSCPIACADDYFIDKNDNYVWDRSKLKYAHAYCFTKVESAMMYALPKVIVANTFTTENELNPYIELAKEYGYAYFSIIVENRHGGVNVHDVPTESIQKQKQRFNIKL